MAQSTDKTLSNLIINRMPQSVYDAKKAAGELSDDELYLTPSNEGIAWHEVANITTEEQTKLLLVSQDDNGKAITAYNPIAIVWWLNFPADSSLANANVAIWYYPSATNADNAIRIISTLSAVKTTTRQFGMGFMGAGHTVVAFGAQNGILSPGNAAAMDGVMDGVRLFINTAGDFFPVGTQLIVSVLGQKP